MGKRQYIVFSAALGFTLLTGCVINPVTGDRELALVSADQEIAIGEQQYAPSQQMQGGEYALDQELTAYVAGVGQKLAAVSDRQLPYEFVVLNSSVPNAWALPGGKIAVNRGLLTELNSEAELAAVLGHEIVHAAARHGALAMQRGLLLQVALARNPSRGAAQRLWRPHGRSSEPRRAVAVDAQQPRSRARVRSLRHALHGCGRLRPERRRHVAGNVRAPVRAEAAATAAASRALFASHPPSEERVAEKPRDRGNAHLRRRPRPRALSSRDGAPARAAAGLQGLRRRPRRARRRSAGRRGTLGAAGAAFVVRRRSRPRAARRHRPAAERRYADAIRHYADAIDRDDDFFYYHLQKGLAHRQLRQWEESRTALETSVRLLPTADAYYALGTLAEQRGDRQAALEYYQQAGSSLGPRRRGRAGGRRFGSIYRRTPASTFKRAAVSTARAS